MDTLKTEARPPKLTSNGWRWLTTLFFVGALAGIAVLLVSDVLRHLRFGAAHQRLTAWPLMLIGLSYLSLQLSAKRRRGELVKGLLLGLAFILWGGQQFLPPTPLVTVMDSAVVTIFVVDLSFIIVEHLKRRDHDLP